VERLYVRHVLARLEGRRMDAARVLGISYPTFLRRLGEE
jgi:two-component system response regulator AtoC